MEKDKEGYSRILKVDESQHIVYGVVLQPDIPDLQGDIITAEEIEKAAHKYMMESRITGFRHKEPLDAAIVESYICKVDEYYENETVKKGSWCIAMKIFDMTVWAGIISGELNSFSIGGFAVSEPVDSGVMVSEGGGG